MNFVVKRASEHQTMKSAETSGRGTGW